ncbi:hypothetical protein DFJ43DRAFT_488290 [Lentinula guzmanii]|uniref:Uncharacterized protein n=1 Tax=Lentinula guzmanii TaxID=2804957 RepID=A0AA38JH91_9AGAR|nr:hypothetical protein DFJ43DRAFT_488290 [Lentinula guzmanii]
MGFVGGSRWVLSFGWTIGQGCTPLLTIFVQPRCSSGALIFFALGPQMLHQHFRLIPERNTKRIDENFDSRECLSWKTIHTTVGMGLLVEKQIILCFFDFH